MALFKVNLSGVQLKDFDPVPAGRYLARVSDIVYSEASKRSKQPKIDITLDLLKGLDGEATTEPPYNGRKAFYTVSLQESSLWNLLRTLVALGDDEEDLKAAGELEISKEDYVGRFCVAVIGHEEYEGVMRQRTRRLEPVPAGFDLSPYLKQ
ncbi:MAG: hypothetical protein QW212_00665 [Nitrososphaerales archaeon]